MQQANDPFEKFREQKIAEKKAKSSATVKCPENGEDAKNRRAECFDPSRNWIY